MSGAGLAGDSVGAAGGGEATFCAEGALVAIAGAALGAITSGAGLAMAAGDGVGWLGATVGVALAPAASFAAAFLRASSTIHAGRLSDMAPQPRPRREKWSDASR